MYLNVHLEGEQHLMNECKVVDKVNQKTVKFGIRYRPLHLPFPVEYLFV